MSLLAPRRPRALIAAGPERQAIFAALFTDQALAGWDALPVQSFGQARFVLQHQPCDVILCSSDLADREGSHGIAWLSGDRRTPLIFLGDDRATHYAQAFDAGAATCLPRALILAEPSLLVRAMQHAMQTQMALISHERTSEHLAESRRHIDRLVQMIWRMTPRHDDAWYPQRHLLERLDEEAERCRRHQVPLSVAVGELQSTAGKMEALPNWAADVIVRGKRRSDVVGQYGPNGFLMLMMHTPKLGGITCCRRMQEALEQGPHAPIRSHFGIATVTAEPTTPQSLLHAAERNLESARTRTESQVVAD